MLRLGTGAYGPYLCLIGLTFLIRSWGPIPWLYPPEIMPLAVRAKGVSLSTATNWAFNWLVGEVTPYLQERIGWRLYPMHGFFCVCSFVLGRCSVFVPRMSSLC